MFRYFPLEIGQIAEEITTIIESAQEKAYETDLSNTTQLIFQYSIAMRKSPHF